MPPLGFFSVLSLAPLEIETPPEFHQKNWVGKRKRNARMSCLPLSSSQHVFSFPPTPLAFILPELLAMILARVKRRSLPACLAVARGWHSAGMSPFCWKTRCMLHGYWNQTDEDGCQPIHMGISFNPWMESYYLRKFSPFRIKYILLVPGSGRTALVDRWVQQSFITDRHFILGMNVNSRLFWISPGVFLDAELFEGNEYDQYSDVALVCFDVTQGMQFAMARRWVRLILGGATRALPALVACKADLKTHRVVSGLQAAVYARKAGIPFFECSALTGEGVTECFEGLGRQALKRRVGECLLPETQRPECAGWCKIC
ncbi:hypothetical protein PAPYR_978 [Paratrimastix pyriformis]|uniref:Uncharacterized protein n=1 Tax=Paratrimastix pyriformis TaxID=342808 RepID=A0ABQ8UT98_9EUKA|nr:hypothetical protein PAPYR_978 [Paratrimastix pyriformis]